MNKLVRRNSYDDLTPLYNQSQFQANNNNLTDNINNNNINNDISSNDKQELNNNKKNLYDDDLYDFHDLPLEDHIPNPNVIRSNGIHGLDEDTDEDINLDYEYGYDYEKAIKDRLRAANDAFANDSTSAIRKQTRVSFDNAVTVAVENQAVDEMSTIRDSIANNEINDNNDINKKHEDEEITHIEKVPLNDTIKKENPDEFQNKVKEVVAKYDADHNPEIIEKHNIHEHNQKITKFDNNNNNNNNNSLNVQSDKEDEESEVFFMKYKPIKHQQSDEEKPSVNNQQEKDKKPKKTISFNNNNNNNDDDVNNNNEIDLNKTNKEIRPKSISPTSPTSPTSPNKSNKKPVESNSNSNNNTFLFSANTQNNNHNSDIQSPRSSQVSIDKTQNKNNESLDTNSNHVNFQQNISEASKVLIEKDGKFLYVDSDEYIAREKARKAQENKNNQPSLLPHPPNRPKTSNGRNIHKVVQEPKNNKPNQSIITRKAHSADGRSRSERTEMFQDFKNDYASHYRSPYAYSPKRSSSQQGERKTDRQKEEKEREKKKENENAFETWLKKKESMRLAELQKKKEESQKNSARSDEDSKKAFNEWLNKKLEQLNKEKDYQKKLKELKSRDATPPLTTQEREVIFRKWLKSKFRAKKEAQRNEKIERKKWSTTVRRSRKHQRLSQAIELAQIYGYTSYYYTTGFKF